MQGKGLTKLKVYFKIDGDMPTQLFKSLMYPLDVR